MSRRKRVFSTLSIDSDASDVVLCEKRTKRTLSAELEFQCTRCFSKFREKQQFNRHLHRKHQCELKPPQPEEILLEKFKQEIKELKKQNLEKNKECTQLKYKVKEMQSRCVK